MKYKVTYEIDEDGWWVATLQGVPGVHTQGRTVGDAKRYIREALAAAVGEQAAATAVLEEDVRLSSEAREALTSARAQRETLEQAKVAIGDLERRAVAAMTKERLSVRDMAQLLGMSHQRVQQLKRAKAESEFKGQGQTRRAAAMSPRAAPKRSGKATR